MKKKASELRKGDRVVTEVMSAGKAPPNFFLIDKDDITVKFSWPGSEKVSIHEREPDSLVEVLPPGYEDVIEAARDVVVNCSMHTLAHYEAVETLKTALRILDKAVKS